MSVSPYYVRLFLYCVKRAVILAISLCPCYVGVFLYCVKRAVILAILLSFYYPEWNDIWHFNCVSTISRAAILVIFLCLLCRGQRYWSFSCLLCRGQRCWSISYVCYLVYSKYDKRRQRSCFLLLFLFVFCFFVCLLSRGQRYDHFLMSDFKRAAI